MEGIYLPEIDFDGFAAVDLRGQSRGESRRDDTDLSVQFIVAAVQDDRDRIRVIAVMRISSQSQIVVFGLVHYIKEKMLAAVEGNACNTEGSV